jgi:hypothetical protein
MASMPLRTRRDRSTDLACRAAQSMCTAARMISSFASSSGLPVSSCISCASRPMYRTMCDFQASRRICRSDQLSAAHQPPAARAASTAASTSRRPCTGKAPRTSPVAGFIVSSIGAIRSPPDGSKLLLGCD